MSPNHLFYLSLQQNRICEGKGVCAHHFKDKDYDQKGRLKAFPVPSVFVKNNPPSKPLTELLKETIKVAQKKIISSPSSTTSSTTKVTDNVQKLLKSKISKQTSISTALQYYRDIGKLEKSWQNHV